MKLTITIEEAKPTEVEIDRPGEAGALTPAVEHPPELAATDAGSAPEWLLGELGQTPPARHVQASEPQLRGDEPQNAGPAPTSSNGTQSPR